MDEQRFLRDLQRAAGAGVVLCLPVPPLCLECGAPTCLCWAPGLAHEPGCTCGVRCAHEFDEDDFYIWEVEGRHARARVQGLPSVVLVAVGPFYPARIRQARYDDQEQCDRCGDDLVGEIDEFNGAWLCCPNAGADPEGGHLEVLTHVL